MQLLPHSHIASHRQANRGGSFSKLCGQQDLANCPGSPERHPEWPCLPQGECCVPRQAGQDRQGRAGRAGLPGQHSHRGILGSQVMWQCKQRGEFTKRQTRGTAPEPGLVSCSRMRVWDWDSWFLLATRQRPGNHLTLLCNNHTHGVTPLEPGQELCILVQVPDRQPWPRNDTSPTLGWRFLCSGQSPTRGSPGQQLAEPGSHPGLAAHSWGVLPGPGTNTHPGLLPSPHPFSLLESCF